MAHVGQDVELECAFSWTEPRELYSIKWWRNNDQFYQYIHKNPEPKMVFNVTGIKVDVSTGGVSGRFVSAQEAARGGGVKEQTKMAF